MKTFMSLHPTVTAIYFLSVTVFTMFSVNPAVIALSLVGALLFILSCDKLSPGDIAFYLGLALLVSVTNPLFSHSGVTPLFFLNGNPVTLEAVLYGVDIALMLVSVICWFRAVNRVFTSDKLLYLAGKLSPKISLLISSALRFIPLIKGRADTVRRAQMSMGLYSSAAWTDKLKATFRLYSALITWSLENAVDTGSSMKARGYGLGKRSHYMLYKFTFTDVVVLAVILLCDVVLAVMMLMGVLDFSFYPSIVYPPVTIHTVLAVAAMLSLFMLPFVLNVKESLLWKYYRSKI